jgi:hypothetical protein
MKKATSAHTLILIAIIVSVLAVVSPLVAYAEPFTGVKKGDWIEYTMSITGPPLDDPLRNLTWYRTEILEVNDVSFRVNKTALTVQGTLSSSIWDFNFAEGQVQGWAIIPANLGTGDAFFDVATSANITIEGEEQKILLDASRTVTHASYSGKVYKEWDKVTGVYVYAVEHTTNYTVITNAIATNMWGPQILWQNQTVFHALVAVSVVLAVLIPSSVIVASRRNTFERPAPRSPSQGKIAALTIILVVMLEVGTIFFFPFYYVDLSFAQINLIMQTIWTALVLASIWFRIKGNYFVHEITMLIVISAWAVGFVAVLFMNPFSSSTGVFSSSPLRLAMNSLHGIFSVPALVFGVWLVLLWRPGSTSFASKSRRLAQLIPLFWVLSYVVGILDFIVLHTTLLG